MAITVTGSNPRTVTVVSATVTTDTLGTNPPNDRSYAIADDVVGIIDPGVAVGGFGLEIQTLGGDDRDITFTNDGFINIAQASEALWLRGDGRITYAGSGTLTNGGSGTALTIQTFRGAAEVTVDGDLTASSGIAVDILALDGITFTQSAGTVISNSIGNVIEAVSLTVGTGPLVATLDGTIIGGGNAVNALSSGDITVDLTGTLFANDGQGIDTATPGVTTISSAGNIDAAGGIGIRAVSQGAGLTTVNLTAGQINGLQGIDFVAQGNGGLVVDMTGGQIGSATQRTLDRGLSAELSGTGAIDITVSNASGIWSELSSAIVAFIGSAASTADLNVVVDGTLDSLTSNGISGTTGAGDIHVTVNGTVTAGNLGLDLATASGSVHVFNAGTITSTSGQAIIFFSGGDDTVTLAPTSVINGIVFANVGNDALQLGGATGVGTFDVGDIGFAQQYQNFEVFNVIGATWI